MNPILNQLDQAYPGMKAEITACLQPVRVGARTIRAMRRSWTTHDLAAIDLILQELGWRMTTINENVGAGDPDAEPLFQVVPIPPGERPNAAADGWVPVPCETCGHWSSQLVEGMCPNCRAHFHSEFLYRHRKPDNDRRK